MFIYHVKPIILTNQNYISVYSQFRGTKTFLMNLSCSDCPASKIEFTEKSINFQPMFQ